MKDLELDRARNPEAAAQDRWEPSQDGEDEDADEDFDINLIDKSTFLTGCYHVQFCARSQLNIITCR